MFSSTMGAGDDRGTGDIDIYEFDKIYLYYVSYFHFEILGGQEE